MCGICGIWGKDDPHTVRAMVDAMYHRGPDDFGIYHDSAITLGMTRLAIIDTGASGHQPMSNHDETVWMVYNGEVYNFQSERAILEAKGYSFRSRSDTEVVLRMYEHYGDDFLLRLRGMFALAIYDKRRGRGLERLLLARDHFGIKPLLVARAGNQVVFASEIKTLLASGLVPPEIDPVALRLLLTYGSVYQPHTILKGVKMLLPAHRMIIARGRERIERYWSLDASRRPEFQTASYDELVNEMTEVLQESVRLQMVSDVPLGAFLSGGVDSSLLVAMMAREVRHKIKTFSVGFESEGSSFDESDEAEKTARFIGTEHTRVLVRGSEVRDRIEHLAFGLDQPSVDGANTYFVSMAARQAVTVAISGNGGDELFAGYPWFIFMVADQLRRQAKPFNSIARSGISAIAGNHLFNSSLALPFGQTILRARNLSGFVTRYGNTYQIFGAAGAAKLLAPDLRRTAQAGRPLYDDLIAIDEVPDGSTIQRVTGLCLRGYNSNQLLRDSDAVSMIHSLEVRVPFLDPVVADAALSLPDEAKLAKSENLPQTYTYRDSGAKRILLDIGKRFLPENFDLQPKRGFAMPFEHWLKAPLREVLFDALSDAQVRKRGLLNPQAVQEVKNAVQQEKFFWAQPWLLMMLELWCCQVLDKVQPVRVDSPAYLSNGRATVG
ncbi:MAG: asparagine synthase (glutamine-hydrolyzing) [Acidobacteriota bacterium]